MQLVRDPHNKVRWRSLALLLFPVLFSIERKKKCRLSNLQLNLRTFRQNTWGNRSWINHIPKRIAIGLGSLHQKPSCEWPDPWTKAMAKPSPQRSSRQQWLATERWKTGTKLCGGRWLAGSKWWPTMKITRASDEKKIFIIFIPKIEKFKIFTSHFFFQTFS